MVRLRLRQDRTTTLCVTEKKLKEYIQIFVYVNAKLNKPNRYGPSEIRMYYWGMDVNQIYGQKSGPVNICPAE